MKKKQTKYFVAVTALLSFVASIFLYQFQLQESKRSDETFVNERVRLINNNLQNEVQKIRTDVHYILSEIELAKSPKFSYQQHKYESSAPFFILKNDELIFWSDQKVAIGSEYFKGDFLWKSVVGKFGIYVLHKRVKIVGEVSYEIVYALPLFVKYQVENNYLRSYLNESIFADYQLTVYIGKQVDSHDLLIDNRTFVGCMKFSHTPQEFSGVYSVWFLFLFISFLLLLAFLVIELGYLHKRKHYIAVLIWLLGCLTFLRAIMLWLDFPTKFIDSTLFDPKLFAYSELFPSMGDLVLNLSCLLITVVYFYKIFPYLQFYKISAETSGKIKFLISVLTIIVSYVLALFFYKTLEVLYFNSQWDYDITRKINFSFFELAYASVFLMLVAIYFLVNRIVFRFNYKVNNFANRESVFPFFAAGLSCFVFNELVMGVSNIVFVINSLYVLAVYYQRLFINFQRFRYGAYVYLILTAISCAGMGAMAVFKNTEYKEEIDKHRFADQLISHHDYQGEFLLGELSEEIQEDAFIKDVMMKPFSSKSLVLQKIKRSYMSNYFDKYDVAIMLYDVNGGPYYRNVIPGNYYDLFKRYNQLEYKTDIDRLFLVNSFEDDSRSNYYKFITLRKNGLRVGYIVINLSLKKISPNSVYPILLQNKKYVSADLKQSYNYAVYDKAQLFYSSGEFNYDKALYGKIADHVKKGEKKFFFRDYHHLIVEGTNDRKVVVSSKDARLNIYNSNFSFLFLLTIVFIFLMILMISIIPNSRKTITNYSTKIHLYLNLAYLFPLVIVSITTLGIINSIYENDLEMSFQAKAESIGANLINYLEKYKDGTLTDEEFQTSVHRLTKYSESDINLFSADGKLRMTTQPLIYEAGLLSNRLNPEALLKIFETKHKLVLLDEMIGTFKFKSVYVSLVLQETGESLGVLSIPFYNSKYQLNDKKIAVFSSIINIFTITFILVLVLSYFASKNLTHPLRLISQKLKRTTLAGDNEKLEWNTRDEIGILVHEYNEMIQKLEESRTALAKKEKESAWKEMAQQVAHEIKNPLTPMKLKIQHLQRTTDPQDHSQEALKSLLQQVDTLSDIATSFSAFAKMPIPIIEEFNLTELVNETVELYRDNKEVNIKLKIPVSPVVVYADKQLMSRVFINLILNGIQAVPKGRKPEIEITMYVSDIQEAVLSFKDNGKGIPEDIKSKVFLPNFSTKFTGSGIGLALAKRGVEHAGGRIWFETSENKGTIFYIVLPMYDKTQME